MRNKKKAGNGRSLRNEEDIKKLTLENNFYSKVLHSGQFSQLVLMNLRSGEEIPEDCQEASDTMLFILKGRASSILNGRPREVTKHDVIFIPSGNLHRLQNVGKHELKLFAIYSPPVTQEHQIHRTPEEAAMAKQKRFGYAWQQ
jgi:mannose-6-phosphate isomerase-like protein (cupin superfamily)